MTNSRGRSVPWLWRDDEEMAKKDDDLRAPKHARGHARGQSGQWQATRVPRRSVMARLTAYAFIICMAFFALYKAVSYSSEPSGIQWPPNADSPPDYHPRPHVPDRRPPERPSKGDTAKQQTYNGPVKFPTLGDSVHRIGDTGGGSIKNRNILFAAASLQSAANLLPMACQMILERRNYVHFALLSRSDISMDDLLKINGIDEAVCPLILHDARTDHGDDSSELRMSIASARGLYHLNMYMHPQAIFVDSTAAEEPYFLSGFRDQIRSTKAALIELPERPGTRLAWMMKLDSSSLAVFNKVHFDVLIHAPPTGSANLKRLLNSLSKADLGGISVPHLTIELPSGIEAATQSALGAFQWPPASARLSSHPQMLTIHHRIPRHRMTEEESSVRFLESFWPRQPSNSHVLVLSPHTEVTPQFFHYVKYALLQYHYSPKPIGDVLDYTMMGMGFSAPSTLLDATQPFTPPKHEDGQAADQGTSFLWQAPSSEAMLILGERWVELHGYVSQLLEKQQDAQSTPALLAKKDVSKKYPAWLEYMLQLSRVRGYYTLYPSRETAGSIIGVHTDLHNVPEEYQDESTAQEEEGWVKGEDSQTFDPAYYVDMLATLPNKGTLPGRNSLPILSWDGEKMDSGKLHDKATDFREQFRREVGQCSEAELAKNRPNDPSAADLFCKKGETA